MAIGFDRTAAGEGVETLLRLEAGKAFFQWSFQLTEPPREEIVRLRLRDGRRETALECVGLASEEEPLQAVLLQPHLWGGLWDPFLYTLEAELSDAGGRLLDRMSRALPLRSLELRGERGVFLNGSPLALKTVRYMPSGEERGTDGRREAAEDLRRLLTLGANSILTEQTKGLTRPFLQLCDRLGILVLTDASYVRSDKGMRELGKIPLLRGEEAGALLSPGGEPSSEYFRFRAKWSGEPFVYLVPESVKRQKNGSYSATVYSSCHRLALYSDGALFEFQSGGEEFVFREIPARGPCVMLSVEGDGCAGAFSVHKIFTKSSRNGDI